MSFSSSPRPPKRQKTDSLQVEEQVAQPSQSPSTGKRRAVRRSSKTSTPGHGHTAIGATSYNPTDDADCIAVQQASPSPTADVNAGISHAQRQSGNRSGGRQKRLNAQVSGHEKGLGTTQHCVSTGNALNTPAQGRARKARVREVSHPRIGAAGGASSDAQELVNKPQTSHRIPSRETDSPLNSNATTSNGRSTGTDLSVGRRPTEPTDRSGLKKTTKELDQEVEGNAVGLDENRVDDNPQFNEQLSMIKEVVLGKLTGQRMMPLVGLDKETEKVRQLLEQSVTAGESNSMLLMGPRGAGKTALVNRVLVDLAGECPGDFYVVRLNGFVQTDDKIALREIWRQLGRELDVEEESKGRAYADTLSTLLAILSHTPEQQEMGHRQASKSIVFIMEEFDLFAGHSRQTLLYNLFDIAQSRKAPIAVLGITTRMDIVESLEKRVKSRFSHRYVILNSPSTFTNFEDICRSALQIRPDEAGIQSTTARFPGRLQKSGKDGPVKRNLDPNAIQVWNDFVERLLKAEATSHSLSRVFHSTKSLSAALSTMVLPVALAAPADVRSSETRIATGAVLLPPDSKLIMLQSLPSLALALLIAAARLEISLDSDACNFNMAYDEYSNLAAKARVTASTLTGSAASRARVWSRKVAKSAWERLVELGIVLPVSGGYGYGCEDMVRCDVALEEITSSVPDMEKQLEQWCREL